MEPCLHSHLYLMERCLKKHKNYCRLRLKYDGTRTETRFRLSAKRTSPFKSAVASVQSTTHEVCASAVVMLDTPCSEVVWRVLATHSIRQFPLHFPSHASPCAITFQLDSTPQTFPCSKCSAPQNITHSWFKQCSGIVFNTARKEGDADACESRRRISQ